MISYTSANIRIWSRLGSCGAFGITALELAEKDKSIVILTADLAFYSGLDRFKTKYPDRIYNLGIAEQNLIGVAAGMAKESLIPFATTYASFASMRCCDQVKVSMGYMKFGIKLVGLTSGLSVGILGATHMSIEDIAIIRAIPNITILSPADCTETVKASLAAAEYPGPVYLRLSGTMGNPIVYHEDYEFIIGKAITLKKGSDISIIATGTMVYYSLKVAEILEKQGISCQVLDMHTIKPIDKDALNGVCNKKMIVTIEEHSVLGGLGGAVAEYLAGNIHRPVHLILGISDEYKHAGSYEYLLDQYGLTTEKILEKILRKYDEVKSNE